MRYFLISLFFGLTLGAFAQDANKRVKVVMETSKGRIIFELYNDTPLHRDNFIKLCESHFYDSLLFHRVIENFMIQSGDPNSRHASKDKLLGESDADYTVPAEFRYPKLFHKRGVLAAARTGDDINPEKASSGSQFYIVWGQKLSKSKLKECRKKIKERLGNSYEMSKDVKQVYLNQGGIPHLDTQYTVFGEVLEGIDIVEKIQRVATDENDRPLSDVRILFTEVIRP